MITRKDYMDNKGGFEGFRLYYAQFVTLEIKKLVEERFTKARLVQALAEDMHLNTIPLAYWDKLAGLGDRQTLNNWNDTGGKSALKTLVSKELLKATKEGWSLATACCILKEAGRQIAE